MTTRSHAMIGWLMALAITLAGAEIICRVFYEQITLEPGRRSVEIVRGKVAAEDTGAYLPHAYGLYMNRPGWEASGFKQNNSLGYRGAEISMEKAKGVVRILALGGSTTYNYPSVLDPSQTWPAQLEALLREKAGAKVEVINGGLNAGTSAEILAQYIFKHRYLKPDIVIYDAGWNDSWQTMLSDYEPDYGRYRLWRGVPVLARAGERALLNHVALARVAYAWWLGNPKLSDMIMFPQEFFDISREKALANIQQHAPTGYARNLEAIVRMAKADSARVILFSEATAPMEVFNHYRDAWAERLYPVLRESYEKVKTETRRAAKAQGVTLAEMKQDSIPHAYFLDHAHVDTRGEAMKAAFLLPIVRREMEKVEGK